MTEQRTALRQKRCSNSRNEPPPEFGNDQINRAMCETPIILTRLEWKLIASYLNLDKSQLGEKIGQTGQIAAARGVAPCHTKLWIKEEI